jgi:hypothetical protein
MVTKCPHCTFPMMYGTFENDFGLVEHEGTNSCRNCKTKFSYRLVGGMKSGFWGFLRGTRDVKYSRIEYWDIEVPESDALKVYLGKLFSKNH